MTLLLNFIHIIERNKPFITCFMRSALPCSLNLTKIGRQEDDTIGGPLIIFPISNNNLASIIHRQKCFCEASQSRQVTVKPYEPRGLFCGGTRLIHACGPSLDPETASAPVNQRQPHLALLLPPEPLARGRTRSHTLLCPR